MLCCSASMHGSGRRFSLLSGPNVCHRDPHAGMILIHFFALFFVVVVAVASSASSSLAVVGRCSLHWWPDILGHWKRGYAHASEIEMQNSYIMIFIFIFYVYGLCRYASYLFFSHLISI